MDWSREDIAILNVCQVINPFNKLFPLCKIHKCIILQIFQRLTGSLKSDHEPQTENSVLNRLSQMLSVYSFFPSFLTFPGWVTLVSEGMWYTQVLCIKASDTSFLDNRLHITSFK